jgi:PBSX family phage portal protein
MNKPRRISRKRSDPSISLNVRTITTTGSVQRADVSRQVQNDYGTSIAGGVAPLPTPYDVSHIVRLYSISNMLKQCIAAKVTNVGLCGFEVVKAHPEIEMDPAEKEELESFIESPNADQTLTTLHSLLVHDKETFGFGFFEVVRDRRGRVSVLRHAPAVYTRVCPKDQENILVTYDVARGPRVVNVREYKRFRIYVQVVGGQVTYFKEFGDPRKLNCKSGRFETAEYKVPPEEEATELVHVRYNSDDPYGVPCWSNQIPSILGSREAEEVNLRYFEDNTVPPMILSVAGGRLTSESWRNLNRMLKSQNVGKERQNQIMLVEAVADRESLDEKGGSIQLKVDKLTDSRPSDALFKDYDEANQAKIRSSFRLPPVAVGLSQDVTFATANVSTFVAESQVYAPDRASYDEVYNKTIVNGRLGLNLKTVKLRSKNPSITNPELLLKALTALNVMGGLTPRSAQIAAASALRTELAFYPEKGEEGYEEWMDQPIALTLRDMTKNSQVEQSVKDQDTKDVEEDGDISEKQPEHGQE